MRPRAIRAIGIILALGAALALGACVDPREDPLSGEEIWGTGDAPEPAAAQIDYRERRDGAGYGLPRPGQKGIADLIALFPTEEAGFNDPDIFAAPGVFDGPGAFQCRGGSPRVVNELPIEIEAVVTIYPRQYMKVTVCGQDERHYGSFTLEDDTGGIVVLRDSRVTPWSYGDRVKVKVNALMLTFGRDLDTRAILLSDIEPAPQAIEGGQVIKPIFFEKKSEPFTAADASRVKQIEGFVHIQPTNDNFGSLVLTSTPIPVGVGGQTFQGEALQCVRSCEFACQQGPCESALVCGDACAEACLRLGGTSVSNDALPKCWMVGVDSELQRRGFFPSVGARLQIRGPVVNNFDRAMWLLDLGQVQELD